MTGYRRAAVQLPLGFGSGLPLYLTGATLTAWLADEGISIQVIGLFALVSLPYNLKFLWAPLLDRFQIPALGRRRGWILVTQVLLIAAITALGGIDPHDSLTLALMALTVASLSASQDIVVDAYRTDVLARTERGKGTAAYVTGYRVALIVAGSGALVLADQVPWQLVYWIMAALMLVGVVGALVAPPPPAIQAPRTLALAVSEPLREFFTRPGALAVLAFVMLYKLGDTLAVHMIAPFLLKLSFTKTEIGILQKALGMGATILGVIIGGSLADRMGLARALLWFGVLQALGNAGYLVLALAGKHHAVLVIAIAMDNLFFGMGTAAFVAYLMSLCHQRFSATQYALLTSASSVLARFSSAISGYAIAALGWAGFFALTMLAALPALAILSLATRQGRAPVESRP